jgi:tetratricopeptide repeat protein
MARQVLFLATTLLLAAGCGESFPSTPAEQGAAYMRAGRYDDAIASYTESIRLNPRDAEAYLYRGRAHHCRNQAGDVDQAIADFAQAIAISPKDPEAYYSRSLAYRDHGDDEKSQDDESTARRLDPRVSETYAQLPDVLPDPTADLTNERRLDDPGTTNKAAESLFGTGAPPATDDDFLPQRRRDLDLPAADRDNADQNPRDRRDRLDPLDPRGSRDSISSKSRSTPRQAADDASGAVRRRIADESDEPLTRQSSSIPRRRAVDPRLDDHRSPTEQRYASPPPTSPWLPRGSFSGSLDGGNPYQTAPSSPFPQRAPRPTGFVEEPQGPYRSQPRGYNSNPYSIPTNRPPGAYHSDLNP